MNRLFKILSLSLSITALSMTAAAAPQILSIRDTISDANLIYPESFETDTKAMMENWYLTNYALIDDNADSRSSVQASDEEYIDRLSKLPTVIEMPYNSIVRGFINMYTDRKKSLVENMLALSIYYMPIFEQALDKYGMPMELKYLPVIESAINPNAVSRAGATGLWQFMLATATGMGLEVNSLVDQRRDPIASSDAAARYLKQLFDTYGDWSLAIAAYNCGPGNVNKALRRAGGGKKDFWEIYPFLPSETRGYVPAFIAANYVMNYYDKHNISPALARRPLITDTVQVSRRVHFNQISEVMNIPVDEIRLLNPQYRTDLIPGDIKPYPLVLPSLQAYCYIANEDSIVNHNAELYSRRNVVEPSDGSVKSSDSKGEYVEELVVRYHTVKRGETLSSIARRYGVSTTSIRKTNKIGKKVRRGQKLRVNTYRRRYIETAPADSTAITPPQVVAPADSIAPAPTTSAISVTDSVAAVTPENPAPAETIKAQTTAPATKKSSSASAKNKKKDRSPRTTTHKVKNGESLTRIAKRYGTTVNELKKINGLKSDNIQIGQSIKVPRK